MQVIPLQPVANQTLTVILAGQNVKLNVYQKYTGLFCDVLLNDSQVIGGVVCQDGNRIVRSEYLGFSGDLVFYDVTGDNDPYFDELGSRYQLIYLTTDDLTTLGLVA